MPFISITLSDHNIIFETLMTALDFLKRGRIIWEQAHQNLPAHRKHFRSAAWTATGLFFCLYTMFIYKAGKPGQNNNHVSFQNNLSRILFVFEFCVHYVFVFSLHTFRMYSFELLGPLFFQGKDLILTT